MTRDERIQTQKLNAKAVLFGLNYGKGGTKVGELRGCVTDIENMSRFLMDTCKIKCESFADTTDLGGKATSAKGIVDKLMELARDSDSIALNLDLAVIHFSGHGVSVPDGSLDEIDGKDECIVPSDIESANAIVADDVLSAILRQFNPATKIVCCFDCCHSGSILDLPFHWNEDDWKNDSITLTNMSQKIICLSGCRDHQYSNDAFDVDGDGKYSGAMTSCLLSVIKSDPELLNDALRLHIALKEKMISKGFLDQHPMLSSSYDLSLTDKVFLPVAA